ncbi:g9100 [Coccomyxa viridis]|uniref:G9100 protein n=1 Tax=Coccomyxa viridis TaxID=1274662 RepID=A0ABP1G4F7_9CHLO
MIQSKTLHEARQGTDLLECPNIRHELLARPSPYTASNNGGAGFVSDDDRVALNCITFASASSAGALCDQPTMAGRVGREESLPISNVGSEGPLLPTRWAVRAGSRKSVFFDSKETTAAIVTCGGLCPGLNDVIQGLVLKLADYGVPEGNILGIRYGFRGFYEGHQPVVLTKKSVDDIQLQGGTILGTSRGGADMRRIAESIGSRRIDMVFVVGGNGGNAGANAIYRECFAINVICSVIALPKSIDNDLLLVERCFGFDTAVEQSQHALMAAKVESSSAYQGIGLVKLMGRQSGFVAMEASMASGLVDICLIPEVPFVLRGDSGLLSYVQHLLDVQGHAVICVAEGAGQDLLAEGEQDVDLSGNPILQDIGSWLRNQLVSTFVDADLKYIAPSYMIRSTTTTATDRVYCKVLAHNAVHAAFAGFTGITVGLVNTHHVYLPIPVVIQSPRQVDPRGEMWHQLLDSNCQPEFGRSCSEQSAH